MALGDDHVHLAGNVQASLQIVSRSIARVGRGHGFPEPFHVGLPTVNDLNRADYSLAGVAPDVSRGMCDTASTPVVERATIPSPVLCRRASLRRALTL